MSVDKSDPVRYFGRQVRKARLAAGLDTGRVRSAHRLRPRAHLPDRERKRPATESVRPDVRPGIPHRGGWFGEFYEESRTWIATPPWFRNWVTTSRAPRPCGTGTGLVDGLLQTEDYARVILGVEPGVTEDEVRRGSPRG